MHGGGTLSRGTPFRFAPFRPLPLSTSSLRDSYSTGLSPYSCAGVHKPPGQSPTTVMAQACGTTGTGLRPKWRKLNNSATACAAFLHSVRSVGAGSAHKIQPAPVWCEACTGHPASLRHPKPPVKKEMFCRFFRSKHNKKHSKHNICFQNRKTCVGALVCHGVYHYV